MGGPTVSLDAHPAAAGGGAMKAPDDVSVGGRDGLNVDFHGDGYIAFTINNNIVAQSVYTNSRAEIRRLHTALGAWLAEQEAK